MLCLPEFSGRQFSKENNTKLRRKKNSKNERRDDVVKIGKIILLALGVVLIALAGKIFLSIPGNTAVFEEAVYLEEPVVLPENEGKFVVIHGDAVMTAPAYDEELGLTLQTVKAYRYAEEYKEVKVEKDVHTWNWLSVGQKAIVGEAMIGGFELDEKTLNAFPVDTDEYFEDFDAQEISAYAVDYVTLTSEGTMTGSHPRVIQNGEFYYQEHIYDLADPLFVREWNEEIINERKGDRAYSYRYYDDAQHGELTVAGVQQGNTLIAHEKVGPVVYDGVKTMEELASSQKTAVHGGSIAFLVLGLLLVFLALRKNKKNRK